MWGRARLFDRFFARRPLSIALALLGAAALWASAASPALALDLVVDTFGDTSATAFRACDPNPMVVDCSLRGAILRANAMPGSHVITLPAGTYAISTSVTKGSNDDTGVTGDLDIAQTITINGAGALTTIIKSDLSVADFDRDRIFDVLSTGALTLHDLSIQSGRSTGGGGVRSAGVLTLDRVSVSLNLAPNGSGIYATNTTTILNSTIHANTVSYGGGIEIFSSSTSPFTVRIENTTISTNEASAEGGGIISAGSNPNVVVTLNNVTVAFNKAANAGGVRNFGSGTLVLRNTIVASNTGTSSHPNCDGAIVSQGHNLVFNGGGDTCSMTNGVNGDIVNNGDPNLGSLGSHGGPTATYALGPGSAAVDKGSPAAPFSGGNACVDTDQRGLTRTIDGDGDGIARCDIGAVEGGVWYAVNTTTDSNDPTFQACNPSLSPYNCSLRGAISLANFETAHAVITVPATGTGNPYRLTLPGAGEDGNAAGDLDIRSSIIIVGGGATTTIIDATGLGDRVFHVTPAFSFTRLGLQDLTVQNGNGGANGGGGIYAERPFSLLRVRLRANAGAIGGGVVLASGSTGAITDSTVSDNNATSGLGGGGIFQSSSGTLTITNSTIARNQSAGPGGGLGQAGPVTANLNNVTIAGNTATSSGGVQKSNAVSTVVSVVNSIIAGNTGGVIGSPNCANALTSQGYNLVFGGDSCGFSTGNNDIVGSDPRLGPLQLNGGSTETMALGSGSAAIDTGNTLTPVTPTPPVGLACWATDQRGVPRPQDGNGVSGARCDIGAFEAAACTTRPRVALGVLPGSTGRLSVNVTAGSGNITELRLHALPGTNILVTSSAGVDQSGELTIPVNATTKQFTIRRASGTGAGTLPFDVVDGCGVWRTLAGGGPNAWGTGGGPGSPSVEPAPPIGPGPAPSADAPLVPGAACATFPSQAAAQAHLRANPTDPLSIDRNRNGIACEGDDGAGFVNLPWDRTPVPRP